MKKILLLLVFFSSFSYSQFSFYKPYQVEVISDIPFGSLASETDQLHLGLEAQQWSVEVLKYWLNEMKKNPFISGDQKVNFILFDSQKRRRILIQVPIKKKQLTLSKPKLVFKIIM